MPLYDYQCAACGRRFEAVHGIHAEGPSSCPLCSGGPVSKAFAPPAIHFKGSGWAKKDRSATARPSKAKTDDGAGTDAPSTDSGASKGDGETPKPKPEPAVASAPTATD